MAQQKKKTTTTKKKTTGSSRSSSSGKRTAKKNQKRPIRREVARLALEKLIADGRNLAGAGAVPWLQLLSVGRVAA